MADRLEDGERCSRQRGGFAEAPHGSLELCRRNGSLFNWFVDGEGRRCLNRSPVGVGGGGRDGESGESHTTRLGGGLRGRTLSPLLRGVESAGTE